MWEQRAFTQVLCRFELELETITFKFVFIKLENYIF
jgi:hypothetical protein